MEVKLVALCVLLAAVHALPYERKCVPSVFKNDVIGNVGQVMNGKAMTLSVIGTAYFDYNAKKEVVIQTLKGDGFMINQTYFRDRANNMSYSLDSASGKCTKWMDKSKSIELICNDTPGLMPVGSLKVGDNILDTYSYDIGIGMETLTFDRESFTLLNVVTLQKILGYDQMSSMQFGNMSTTGIPASVWELPAICKN